MNLFDISCTVIHSSLSCPVDSQRRRMSAIQSFQRKFYAVSREHYNFLGKESKGKNGTQCKADEICTEGVSASAE